MSYHINPTTGRVGKCRAVRACPFGDMVEDHYETRAEAQKVFESLMASHVLTPAVVRDELKEMDADGLAQGFLKDVDAAGFPVEEFSDALELASLLHAGKLRLNRGPHERTPYIEHPLRASYRLFKLGVRDKDVLVAALLHDTVEDCSQVFMLRMGGMSRVSEATSRRQLLHYIGGRYGRNVASIVKAVTNDARTEAEEQALTPQDKYRIYKEHLQAEIVGSPQAALVKLSDFIDNAGGLHHNDIPGHEKKIKKSAEKYLPCVEVFRQELLREDFPLPPEGKERVLYQLERTEGRLAFMVEKYRNL